MVRVCSVAFAVLVAAVMSASPRAQGRPEAQTPPAGEVRIIATGSFLGQFDGFVTNPGHSRDTNAGTGFRPYGGLLGVIDFLHARWGQATPPAGELLLIAGDNASHGFAGLIRGEHSSSFGPSKRFWTELAKLQPAAVALWSEDFYRALAPPSREADSNAGRFANFIARREIPFLASNAAIRLHKTRLNTIENAGIELEIDRDRSLAWVDKLSLRFDCDREDLTYTLRAGAASIASNALTSTGDDDPCHAEIELTAPLKPGQEYDLAVTSAGHPVAHLSFHTDLALTPHHDGLPAVVPASDTQPIITALVDPAIRQRLPQEDWEWEPSAEEPTCPAEKCEIVLNDPLETFEVLEAWLAPHGERYFALLSGIRDADATVLFAEPVAAAMKFVVLPADSGMLGQGTAPRTAGTPQIPNPTHPSELLAVPDPPYEGTWGSVAVLDGPVAPAARAWVRAEWIGTNVATIRATITRRPAKRSEKDGDPPAPEWDADGLRAESVAVRGYRLCAVAGDGEKVISYKAAEHDPITAQMRPSGRYTFDLAVAERYPVYASDRTYDGRHQQGKLWIDRGEFAAMALDLMRRELSAEIALFPENTVDDDYLGVLAAEQKASRPLNWLSREILNRALFRADRIVRVKVEGSKLAEALEKMVADDGGFCAAGLGATSCGLTKIDTDHLRVNGRKIQPDHFYGIAMPAGLAAAFAFEDAEASESLLDLIDGGLRKEAGGAVDTCAAAPPAPAPASPAVTPLGERLESAHANRVQGYYLFKPLSAEFSATELNEPAVAAYRGTFSSLPLAGSKADDQTKWAVDGGLDAGFDWRKFVLHGIGTVKYGKTRIHPHAAEGPTRTTDPDEYKLGARFDWRAWPGSLDGKFYAGAFLEGEISREVIFADGSFPEPSNVKRRRYLYATFGAEVDNPATWGKLAVKQIRAGLSRGTSYSERSGVVINGGVTSIPLATSLDEILKTATDRGVEVTSLAFEHMDVQRTRGELEALMAFPLYTAHRRDAKLSFTAKYFYYWDTKTPALTFVERHNALGKVEVVVPLWRVFDAGFMVENQRVWLRDGKLYSVVRSSASIKWPLFGKRGSGIIW